MKRERRVLYKLVHKDMNKTGLAESLSYGDFIPELDNRRHLYIKTRYGEDITIKDEQVLGLESVADNFIQIGKKGDKTVELSLMFLTKWNSHEDHYTLDGEISFDELWEGVRPQEFISYTYYNKNKKDMVQFMNDLSVFCYDREETSSARQITLHEKLEFLSRLFKACSKNQAEMMLNIYKKHLDIRLWVTSKGPWELYKYMKELLDLGKVLLEGSRLVDAGKTKDFGDLLDKLEEIELYPKVRRIDLTGISSTEKVPIKLITDNASPVVSNTAIYSTDTLETAIDAIFVHHNRYGDILNAYKAGTPEVTVSGNVVNTETKKMVKSTPMNGKQFNKKVTFEFNNRNDLTIVNIGKDITYTNAGRVDDPMEDYKLIYNVGRGETKSVSNLPYNSGDILMRKEGFKSFFYKRDGREVSYANSYIEGDVNQNINGLKVDTITHHAVIHNIKAPFTDNLESRLNVTREKMVQRNYLVCQSLFADIIYKNDNTYYSFIRDRIYGSNLMGIDRYNDISINDISKHKLFEKGLDYLPLTQDSNMIVLSMEAFINMNYNSAGLAYGDNISKNFYGYGSNIFTTSSIFGKSSARFNPQIFNNSGSDYRSAIGYSVGTFAEPMMPLRKSKHSNDIGVYDLHNSAVDSMSRVLNTRTQDKGKQLLKRFDRYDFFDRELEIVYGDKYIITNVTMHTNIGNSAKHRYLADNIDYLAMRRGYRFWNIEFSNGILYDMNYLAKLYSDMQYKGDNSIILNVFVREMSSYAYNFFSEDTRSIHLNQALGTKLNKSDFEMLLLVKDASGRIKDVLDCGESFLLNRNIDGEWLQFTIKEDSLDKNKYRTISDLSNALNIGYSLVMVPKSDGKSNIKNDILNGNFLNRPVTEIRNERDLRYNKNNNWFLTKKGNNFEIANSFQSDIIHKTSINLNVKNAKSVHIIADIKQDNNVLYDNFNKDLNMSFNSDMSIHKTSLDTGNRSGVYTTTFSDKFLNYSKTHKEFTRINQDETFDIPVRARDRNDFLGSMYYDGRVKTYKSNKILGDSEYTIIGKDGTVISDRKLRDEDGSLFKLVVPYGTTDRSYNLVDTYGENFDITVDFGISTTFKPIYYQESSLSLMFTTNNYIKRTGLSPAWVNYSIYGGMSKTDYYENEYSQVLTNVPMVKEGLISPDVLSVTERPWLFVNPMLPLFWLINGDYNNRNIGYEKIKSIYSSPMHLLEYSDPSYIFGDSRHIMNSEVLAKVKEVVGDIDTKKASYLDMTKSNIRMKINNIHNLFSSWYGEQNTIKRNTNDAPTNNRNLLASDNEIMDKIRIDFPYHDTTLLAAYIKESTAQLTWDLIVFLMNKYKSRHGIDNTFYIGNSNDRYPYKLNVDDINQEIPPHLFEFSLWRDLRLHDTSALSTYIRKKFVDNGVIHNKLESLAAFEIDFVRMIEEFDVTWLNNLKDDLNSIDNTFTKILARLYENIQWETHDAIVINFKTSLNMSYYDLYDKRNLKHKATGDLTNDLDYQKFKSEVDIVNGRVRKIGVFTENRDAKNNGFGVNPLLANMSKLVSIAFAESFKTIHRIVMDVATTPIVSRTRIGYTSKITSSMDVLAGTFKSNFAYQTDFTGINKEDATSSAYFDTLNLVNGIYKKDNIWILKFPEYEATQNITKITVNTQALLKDHIYGVHKKMLSIIDSFMENDILNGDPIKYITHTEYENNKSEAFRTKDECVWFKTSKSMSEILKSEDIGAEIKLPNIHMDITEISTNYGRAMKYVYDTVNNYQMISHDSIVYKNRLINLYSNAGYSTGLYYKSDIGAPQSMYEFDKFRVLGAPTADYPQDRNLIPFKSIDLKRPMDLEIDFYGKANAFVYQNNTWKMYDFSNISEDRVIDDSFYSGLFVEHDKGDYNIVPIVYFNAKIPYMDKHSDRPRYSNLEFKDNEVVLAESAYILLPKYNRPKITAMFNNENYKSFYKRISVNYYFYLYQMNTQQLISGPNASNPIIDKLTGHANVGEMPRSNYLISEMLFDLDNYKDRFDMNSSTLSEDLLRRLNIFKFSKQELDYQDAMNTKKEERERQVTQSLNPIFFNVQILKRENNGFATVSYNKYTSTSNDLDSILDKSVSYDFYGINLAKETILHHRYLEPRDFYGTLQSTNLAPGAFITTFEHDLKTTVKPVNYQTQQYHNGVHFKPYFNINNGNSPDGNLNVDGGDISYADSGKYLYYAFTNYASTQENIGLPNTHTKVFTYKPIDMALPISTHLECNFTWNETKRAIPNLFDVNRSVNKSDSYSITRKTSFIKEVSENMERFKLYDKHSYKEFRYSHEKVIDNKMPNEYLAYFGLENFGYDTFYNYLSYGYTTKSNMMTLIDRVKQLDLFNLSPLNTVGTAMNGSIIVTDDWNNCNVELAAHIFGGSIVDNRRYKGNNSIFIEKDGNIYLKGGKSYLVRTNASDLTVSRGNQVPISHYPIYDKIEYLGEKSYQGNVILLSNKGNPYVLGNPILNDFGFNTSEVPGEVHIPEIYSKAKSYGYDNTNLLEMMRYMFSGIVKQGLSNVHSKEDIDNEYRREVANEFKYKDLNHAILGIMEASTYDFSYPLKNKYELGNQNGDDFANVWYARLAQVDNNDPNIFRKKTFIYPEMSKVSDLKLSNIATENEIDYHNTYLIPKYQLMFSSGVNNNMNYWTNQFLFGFNYGQGTRLTPKEFIVNKADYSTNNSSSTNPIWNTEIFHKNKVINQTELARNVAGADPYTYKSNAVYYFKLSENKPKYSTFRLLDQKTGQVKYLRRRYLTPIMYRVGNDTYISRNISGYESDNRYKEYIEVVVYLSKFTGSVPDNTYDYRGIFVSKAFIDGWKFGFITVNKVKAFTSTAEFKLIDNLKGIQNNDLVDFMRAIVNSYTDYTVFIRIPEDKSGTDASNYVRFNSII